MGLNPDGTRTVTGRMTRILTDPSYIFADDGTPIPVPTEVLDWYEKRRTLMVMPIPEAIAELKRTITNLEGAEPGECLVDIGLFRHGDKYKIHTITMSTIQFGGLDATSGVSESGG